MCMPKILLKGKRGIKLNEILYITMFIMGTVLGSFYTLAVYRIPLKKDITHERSFCPNCNHRLEFLDLIPVLSYIFLGGKCRYCKQKIRPRYLILEICSGLLFMLFYMSLKIDIFNLEINKICYLIFGIFYLSTILIIAGIEKEKHYIPNSLFIFGAVISLLYIIYLYIIHASIYKYVIYFVIMAILIFLNTFLQNQKMQNYYVQLLTLLVFMLIGTNEKVVLIGIALTLVLSLITKLTNKDKQIPFGLYLIIANIITMIVYNYINI